MIDLSSPGPPAAPCPVHLLSFTFSQPLGACGWLVGFAVLETGETHILPSLCVGSPDLGVGAGGFPRCDPVPSVSLQGHLKAE